MNQLKINAELLKPFMDDLREQFDEIKSSNSDKKPSQVLYNVNRDVITEVEKQLLPMLMVFTDLNQSEAALVYGKNRATLRKDLLRTGTM